MPAALGKKKVEQLFATWCELQSILGTAKVCKVSHTTVRRYLREQNWPARYRAIQAKAQAKADDRIAEQQAESLTLIREAKCRVAERIRTGDIKSHSTIADLDRLVRLEQLLIGGPDQRTETIVEIEYVEPEKKSRDRE